MLVDLAALNRAVHLAASLLPAGGFIFILLLARPAAAALDQAGFSDLRLRLLRVMRWSVPVALVSGALWLAEEAVSMSGLPVRDALTPRVIGTVLGSTLFGQLWLLRAIVLTVLAARLLRPRAADDGPGGDVVALLLAGTFVVSLAWAGHAAGPEGGEGAAMLTSQMIHLLASAGWLGTLSALVMVLDEARRTPATLGFAAAVTRRFSPLGMVCVAALVATGIVNSWVLVGSIPQLFGTTYGRLLVVKLAMVLGMLALAAFNRVRLTPGLAASPVQSVRALSRTAAAETGLGLAVLIMVGFLGATPPAAHEQPVWPFSFALSAAPILWDGRLVEAAWTDLAIGGGGLAVITAGLYWRKALAIGLGAIVAGGALLSLLNEMVVPAYPTSFMQSPAPFAASNIVAGAEPYLEYCAGCHGASGRGDGPSGTALRPPPADLTAHLGDHSDGEIFWWIGNGIAGSAMPGFAPVIAPAERWDLVQFLRAQAAGARATAVLRPRVSPFVGVEAPDFTLQIDDAAPETLAGQRGVASVLLVFYTRPQSDARLQQLTAARPTFYGARVIAIPLYPGSALPETAEFVAATAPETLTAYGLYGAGGPTGEHAEYLIDRAGYVRARWRPGEPAGWDDIDTLKTEIARVEGQPFRPVEPPRHVH